MQRVLEKIAKQLNSYDEASLMQLWQHYAEIVHEFEPTKKWEEAAVSFCLIQAIHWKNQLFNYHLALTASPADKDAFLDMPDFLQKKSTTASHATDDEPKQRATLLRFPDKHLPDENQSTDNTDETEKP